MSKKPTSNSNLMRNLQKSTKNPPKKPPQNAANNHVFAAATSPDELVEVALIGKTCGVRGALRLHDRSDFAEQFRAGAEFFLADGRRVKIKSAAQNCVIFAGFESVDAAQGLVNERLFRTKAQTRRECRLKKGEFFWFDVLGCEVRENGELLGIVEDILESGAGYLLGVKTARALAGGADETADETAGEMAGAAGENGADAGKGADGANVAGAGVAGTKETAATNKINANGATKSAQNSQNSRNQPQKTTQDFLQNPAQNGENCADNSPKNALNSAQIPPQNETQTASNSAQNSQTTTQNPAQIQPQNQRKTAKNKVKNRAAAQGLAKFFYLPYHDNFVISIDIASRQIAAKNARAILENS